jgi:hypothetical protein
VIGNEIQTGLSSECLYEDLHLIVEIQSQQRINEAKGERRDTHDKKAVERNGEKNARLSNVYGILDEQRLVAKRPRRFQGESGHQPRFASCLAPRQ